jgi:DNA-binding response OmpR family regulator
LDQSSINLDGKRIMVVEDDFLLASAICEELRQAGATVLGPAPTAFYGSQLIGHRPERPIHAAVLDIHLYGQTVYTLADLLVERAVPIMFATGGSSEQLPARFSKVPVLNKPYDVPMLLAKIAELTRSTCKTAPVREIIQASPRMAHLAGPVEFQFAHTLARTLGAR